MADIERCDFSIVTGETFNPTIDILSADGTTPTDITGATASMEWRQRPNDAPVVVTATIPTGTDGRIALYLATEATAVLDEGIYHYDLRLVLASGVVEFPLRGSVTVELATTRP